MRREPASTTRVRTVRRHHAPTPIPQPRRPGLREHARARSTRETSLPAREPLVPQVSDDLPQVVSVSAQEVDRDLSGRSLQRAVGAGCKMSVAAKNSGAVPHSSEPPLAGTYSVVRMGLY
jgi:hypothetical protein